MEGVSLRRRACVVCGEPFTERGRIDRMYCSNGGCRTLAWKQRRHRKLDARTRLDPGTEDSPSATYPDYAPHGTLVQLAQRLEAERISTQRTLHAAQQRIAELEKNRDEGESLQSRQSAEEISPLSAQAQTAEADRNRIAELEKVLSAMQQENALLQGRLQETQHQHAELQTAFLEAQVAHRTAEERAQAAEQSAAKAHVQLLTHAQAQHAVDSIEAALRVHDTAGQGAIQAWFDAHRRLLHRVAVSVARDAQGAVTEAETDREAIAMRALDWTRGRILSELAEPHLEQMRILFQEHRLLFCQLAENVTVRVQAGKPDPGGTLAARSASDIAQETLDWLSTRAGQTSVKPSDPGEWGATQRPILLNFCQRVVARARYAASVKRAVTTSEVTAGSLSDIGWRYFDQPAVMNRWAAENRSTLENLTAALLRHPSLHATAQQLK